MTLQQLIYFREIASTLHFTRAAENLYITQSSLSHSINALERELGVALFSRQSGKSISLTTYGREFLPYVNKILNTVEESKAQIDALRNPLGGVVRVSFGYINGISSVTKLFKSFYKESIHSEIDIQFQINYSSQKLEKALLAGETDLAFTSSPVFHGLNGSPVMKQKLYVAVPSDHRLSSYARLTLEDICREPLIGYNQGLPLDTHINKMFLSSGYRPNTIDYQPTWAEEIACISLGLGIGILPKLPVDESLVKLIPLDHPMSYRSLYLYWQQDAELSPAAEYVRQYSIDFFKQSASEDEL